MTYLESPRLDQDPVLPGEQWFCYWKTSASLWEGRILQMPAHQVIFIPINWGFHEESLGSWDFGKSTPDRDLLRLTQLLSQHRRKFCWLLPVSPAPFLPNGGVPVSAARTLSISSNGVHLSTLDPEDILHKIYSFFEPKVFAAYTDFLSSFGRFLGENKIKAPVWGTRFEYLEQGEVISYIEDFSLAFEQGFSRYLKQNPNQGQDLNDPLEEKNRKKNFTAEVQKLFESTAEAALSPFWMGVNGIVMLGGSPRETLGRVLPDGKSPMLYFEDLFNHFTNDRWPSSCLLKKQEKGELLPRALEEHFGETEIERRYRYSGQSRSLTEDWKSFELIDVFDQGLGPFGETGLYKFLDENFRWLYKIHKSLDFSLQWVEESQEKIKFFHAKGMDRTSFGQALKLFLMGQTVVIDKSGLSPDLEKRLQVFYVENNLKIQSVNFMTSINLCYLGEEGKLITYEGSTLNGKGNTKDFWGQILKFIGLDHLSTEADTEIFNLWRIRASGHEDLNYVDVRRVNFYNPTSYKKHVTIHTQGRFALMKMIDPHRARAQSVPHGVEIELLPNGRLALDFGHYEER